MSSDLHALLDRGVGQTPAAPDLERLADRGARRRRAKRWGGVAVAALAVVAVSLTVLDPSSRDDLIIGQEPSAGPSWIEIDHGPLLPRSEPQMVVDGDRVLVWGGEGRPASGDIVDAQGAYRERLVFQDGAIYDHAGRTWVAIPPPPLPPRVGPQLGFAGDSVVVWGGHELEAVDGGGVHSGVGAVSTDGAVYDLRTERWQPLPEFPLTARQAAVVHWDGEVLLVWGTSGAGPDVARSDGATWTAAGGWRLMADFPLSARAGSALGVDRQYLAVWGGGRNLDAEAETLLADGAVYDRRADAWTVVAEAPLSPRWFYVSYPPAANALIRDGRMLVAGGGATTPEPVQAVDGAWMLLDGSGWEPIPDAPAASDHVGMQTEGVHARVGSEDPPRVSLFDDLEGRWLDVGAPAQPHGSLVAGPRAVLSTDGVAWPGAERGWRPVTVVEGHRRSSPLLDDGDHDRRFWASLARLDSGVLLWSGFGVDLDADGTYHGDGSYARGGWFLPLTDPGR
jgi:hypothetical protein